MGAIREPTSYKGCVISFSSSFAVMFHFIVVVTEPGGIKALSKDKILLQRTWKAGQQVPQLSPLKQQNTAG